MSSPSAASRPTPVAATPMAGLVTRKPMRMSQPTRVTPAPSDTPGRRAAAAKADGTSVAQPNPARANPPISTTGAAIAPPSTTRMPPTAMSPLPAPATCARPNRSMSASPANRPSVCDDRNTA